MSEVYMSHDEKNISRYFKVMIVMKENGPAFKIYNLKTIVKIQSYARMITPKKYFNSARIIYSFSKKWILQKRFTQSTQKAPMKVSVSTIKKDIDSELSRKELDNSSSKQRQGKSYKNVLLHLVKEQQTEKLIEKEHLKKGKSLSKSNKSNVTSLRVTTNKRFEKGIHWCRYGTKCRKYYNHKGFEDSECNFKHIEQAGVNRYPKEHEKCPACIVYKGDCTCCYEILM